MQNMSQLRRRLVQTHPSSLSLTPFTNQTPIPTHFMPTQDPNLSQTTSNSTRKRGSPRYADPLYLMEMLTINTKTRLPEGVDYHPRLNVNPYEAFYCRGRKKISLGCFCNAQHAGSAAASWHDKNDDENDEEELLTHQDALDKADQLKLVLKTSSRTASGFMHVKYERRNIGNRFWGQIRVSGKNVLFKRRLAPAHAALDVARYLAPTVVAAEPVNEPAAEPTAKSSHPLALSHASRSPARAAAPSGCDDADPKLSTDFAVSEGSAGKKHKVGEQEKVTAVKEALTKFITENNYSRASFENDPHWLALVRAIQAAGSSYTAAEPEPPAA